MVKCRFEDFRGSIPDFNIAIKLDSTQSEYYYWRGLAKKQLFDFVGAIKDFSIAIEINPTYSDAFYSRGISKIYSEELESGCIDLSKAGELGYMDAYKAKKSKCN
jgi:lipoprotein NlpI